MHWVKATTHDGRPQFVNIEAVVSMSRLDGGTVLFFGAMAIKPDGSPMHATASVRETPEELLAMPIWRRDPGTIGPGSLATADADPLPRSETVVVSNRRVKRRA